MDYFSFIFNVFQFIHLVYFNLFQKKHLIRASLDIVNYCRVVSRNPAKILRLRNFLSVRGSLTKQQNNDYSARQRLYQASVADLIDLENLTSSGIATN